MHATQHLVSVLVCAKIGVGYGRTEAIQQFADALVLEEVGIRQSAAYPDELDWLSRQVSWAEDPPDPRARTPCGVWESPLSLT